MSASLGLEEKKVSFLMIIILLDLKGPQRREARIPEGASGMYGTWCVMTVFLF